MFSPFISVIVPNFNYQDYILDCINSLLAQDYPNFEIIVVDDGSTDNSWSAIQSFGGKIKAVRIENGGALGACIAGTDLSRGDYIYVLDADDRLGHTNALSVIAAVCASRPSKVQFPLSLINAAGDELGMVFPAMPPDLTSRELIERILVDGSYTTPPTSGNVYRRDVWESVRQVDYEKAQDGIAYLLAPFCGDVITLEAPLAQYRHHSRMDSERPTSDGRLLHEAERFARRIEHLRQLLPAATAQRLKPGTDFFFVRDRLVVHHSLYTDHLEFRLIGAALKSLFRSGFDLKRKMMFGTWLVALPMAPRRVRQYLVEKRQKGDGTFRIGRRVSTTAQAATALWPLPPSDNK